MSGAAGEGPRDATSITRARNQAVREALPFLDTQDFDDAARGFVGSLPEVEITNAQGRVVWSLRDYAFLAEVEAPATVNPSLWRQARLNMHHGLFQVTDRIYQIRGFDVSNMTMLEGDGGIVVIDPLISTETARAGLDLYTAHRGRRPVTAVIYTHSRVDHYGGVRGVVEEAAVPARPGGRGPRQGHLPRNGHAHPADADQSDERWKPIASMGSRSCSRWRRRPRRRPRCTCSIPRSAR